MPRSKNPTLESLLLACETQSTVDITLRDGTIKYFCTGDLEFAEYLYTISGNAYLSHLMRVGELKETLGQATNNVPVVVSNVNKLFGLNVAAPSRKTELADVVIRRFYRHETNPAIYQWKHFFTGKAVSVVVDEQKVAFEVIPDTTAAGTCIATVTLSPNNGFKFPEIPDQSAPGTGGNPGGGIGGGGCFVGETDFVFFDKTRITFAELFDRRKEFVGQKIARSYDEQENPVAGEIKNIFRFLRLEYLRVAFEDGSVINVTPEHPFYTEDFVYTEIGKLRRNDYVFTDENDLVRIVGIETVKKHTGVWVYNVEIGEFENYSAGGKRVHNKKSPYDFE